MDGKEVNCRGYGCCGNSGKLCVMGDSPCTAILPLGTGELASLSGLPATLGPPLASTSFLRDSITGGGDQFLSVGPFGPPPGPPVLLERLALEPGSPCPPLNNPFT